MFFWAFVLDFRLLIEALILNLFNKPDRLGAFFQNEQALIEGISSHNKKILKLLYIFKKSDIVL
jgi:hypothetical protein